MAGYREAFHVRDGAASRPDSEGAKEGSMSHAIEPESPAAEGLLPGIAEKIERARERARAARAGRPGYDAEGNRLPETDEERARRSESFQRLLEEWGQQPTDESDTDEVWAEIMRGIDEERPQRKLFEGYY
jgi:hypothetical protein